MRNNSLNIIVLFLLISLICLTFSVLIPKVCSLNSYVLTLKVKDSRHAPLHKALVRVTTLHGPDDYRSIYNETDENGMAVFHLQSVEPLALVRIIWKGITVALVNIPLQAPKTSITVLCEVSDLEISVSQANGNPVKNAYVKLSWKIDVSWELEAYSDDNGVVLFKQMPHYDGYTLLVKWKEKTVYQKPLQFNGEKEPFHISCNIFDLTIRVLDKRGIPTPEADIDVIREDNRQESKQTDNGGTAVFNQLAIGNYTLKISYGQTSFQTNLSLTSDQEIEIILNTTVLLKYYVEVSVKWTDGKYAKDVKVEIWSENGKKVASGITDNSGKFRKQLLEGNYTVKISICDYSESQKIMLSHDVTLNFEVSTAYRISTVVVKVLDEKGKPADGAQVEILVESVVFAYGTTNTEGIATFNLPDGTYHIKVTYSGETLEQTAIVAGDQTILLNFQRNINLQEILIGIGLLSLPILVISVLFYARKRRNKRGIIDSRTLKD